MSSRKYIEYIVSVALGTFTKHCMVQGKKQRCHNKPKFMVFNLDGKHQLSRLDSSCCDKHLPRAVRVADKANQERMKNNST